MPRTRTRTSAVKKKCETPDQSLPVSTGREGKSILKRRQRKPLQEVVDLHLTENTNVSRSSNRRVSFAVSEVKEFRQPVNEGTLWGNSYIYDIQKSSSESEHTESSPSDLHTFSSGHSRPGLFFSHIVVEETLSVTFPPEDEIEDIKDDLQQDRYEPRRVIELIDHDSQTEESVFKRLEESTHLNTEGCSSCEGILPNENLANKVFNPNNLFLQQRLNTLTAEETVDNQNNYEDTSKLSCKRVCSACDDSKISKKQKIGECFVDHSLEQWLRDAPENTCFARRQLTYSNVNKQSQFSLQNTDVLKNDSDLSMEGKKDAEQENYMCRLSVGTATEERSNFFHNPHTYFKQHGGLSYEDQVSSVTPLGIVRDLELNEKEGSEFKEHALDLSFSGKSNNSNINDGDMSFTLPKGSVLCSDPYLKIASSEGNFNNISDSTRVTSEKMAKQTSYTVVNDKKYLEECATDNFCDNSNTLSFTVAGGGLLERKNFCKNSRECDNDVSVEDSPTKKMYKEFQNSFLNFIHIKNCSPTDSSYESISPTVTGGRILDCNQISLLQPDSDMNITDKSISPTVAIGRILNKDEAYKTNFNESVNVEETMSQTVSTGNHFCRNQTSVVASNVTGNKNVTNSDISQTMSRGRIMAKELDTKSCHVSNAYYINTNVSPKITREGILDEQGLMLCQDSNVNIDDRSVSLTVGQGKILSDVPTSLSDQISNSMNVIDQSVSLTEAGGGILDMERVSGNINDFVKVNDRDISPSGRTLNEQTSSCHFNDSVNIGRSVSPIIARGILDEEQILKCFVNNFVNVTDDSVSTTIARGRILDEELISKCHVNNLVNVTDDCVSTTERRNLDMEHISKCSNNLVNITDECVPSTTERNVDNEQVSKCNNFVNFTEKSISLTSARNRIFDYEQTTACHVDDLGKITDENKPPTMMGSIILDTKTGSLRTNQTDNADVIDDKVSQIITRNLCDNQKQLSSCNDRSLSQSQIRISNENEAPITGVATVIDIYCSEMISNSVGDKILDNKSELLRKCSPCKSLDIACKRMLPNALEGQHLSDTESLQKNSINNSMDIDRCEMLLKRDKVIVNKTKSPQYNNMIQLSCNDDPLCVSNEVDSNKSFVLKEGEEVQDYNECKKVQNTCPEVSNSASNSLHNTNTSMYWKNENGSAEQKASKDSTHKNEENHGSSISPKNMLCTMKAEEIIAQTSSTEEISTVETMEVCNESNHDKIDGSNSIDNKKNIEHDKCTHTEHNRVINFERGNDSIHSCKLRSSETNTQLNIPETQSQDSNDLYSTESSDNNNLACNNAEIIRNAMNHFASMEARNGEDEESGNVKNTVFVPELIKFSLGISGLDFIGDKTFEEDENSIKDIANGNNPESTSLQCSLILPTNSICEKVGEHSVNQSEFSSLSISVLDELMSKSEFETDSGDDEMGQLRKSLISQGREDFLKERGSISVADLKDIILSAKRPVLETRLHSMTLLQDTSLPHSQQTLGEISKSTDLTTNSNENRIPNYETTSSLVPQETSVQKEIDFLYEMKSKTSSNLPPTNQAESSHCSPILQQISNSSEILTRNKSPIKKFVQSPKVSCEYQLSKHNQETHGSVQQQKRNVIEESEPTTDPVKIAACLTQTSQISCETKPLNESTSSEGVASTSQLKRRHSPAQDNYTTVSNMIPDNEFSAWKRPCQSLRFTPMANNQKFHASVSSNESNTDLSSLKCSVEKWIMEQQKSKKCCWEMEELSHCKMNFHFLEKNLQILVEIDSSTSNVREITITSHLEGSNMKLFMRDLFLRRLNPNSLKEKFPSKENIPDFIKFVATQEDFLLDFCQDFCALKIAHDVKMRENSCVEFQVNSMVLTWLFTIKIDFSAWDGGRLHSRYVEVYPVLGEVNTADIKRLVRAIPGGPHFLKEYIDHLYDYIQTKEVLEGNNDFDMFYTT